jgi:hypothetical protein
MVTAQGAVDALCAVVARMRQVAYTPITDDELHDLLHRPSFELLGIAEPAQLPRA